MASCSAIPSASALAGASPLHVRKFYIKKYVVIKSSNSELFQILGLAGSRRIAKTSNADNSLRGRSYVSATSEGSEADNVATDIKKPTVVRRRKVDLSPPGDFEAQLEALSVEDERVSVEGVAKVDRGEEHSSFFRIAKLVGGDLAGLLLFSWIGRASHVSTAVDLELLNTAFPFIAGWILSASVWGDYRPGTSPPTGVTSAALMAARTWALGVPAGIVIRGLIKGQVPPQPFILVTMTSTLVLLVGWRAAYAALAQGGAENPNSGNRRGNPLEFFELLSSLVRRW